jgi:hypothetical protein
MARPYNPARGRQPFSPPATEIERSKVRVAVSEAEQWSQRNRSRRLYRESRRLQERFERLRAAFRSSADNADARKELVKDVGEAFEQVMKFFSAREVQQAIPEEAAKAARTTRDLYGKFHATCDVHPAAPASGAIVQARDPGRRADAPVIPVDSMLVVLTAIAVLLRRKLAA